MQLILALAVALLLALVAIALVSSSRRPGAGPMELDPWQRHRPNVLYWLAGTLVMGLGVVVILSGAEAMSDASHRADQFEPAGAEATADATSSVFWGVVVLTIGAYVWRAGRRRGWEDRVGRLVIIVGYLLLGVAVNAAVHEAVDIWTVGPAAADAVQRDTMVALLSLGVPAAVIVTIGTWLARERLLLTVYVRFG